MSSTSTTTAPAPRSTSDQIIQTCGSIAISIIVCATFLIALRNAYETKDTDSIKWLMATLTAAFMTVVTFWVGSSISSHKKDNMLLSTMPPTVSTTTVHVDDSEIPPPPPSPKAT
mgnify:CR=1 FL=1